MFALEKDQQKKTKLQTKDLAVMEREEESERAREEGSEGKRERGRDLLKV